jgi:hypothetical protein
VCDTDQFILETEVFQRLLQLGVVKQGNYALASEQLRVRSSESAIIRRRFWKLDSAALTRWVNAAVTDPAARRDRSRMTSNATPVDRLVRRKSAKSS